MGKEVMRVQLVACTKSIINQDSRPEDLVEKAASVCYDSSPTKKCRIAKSCAESGHMSVWEHISFTFRISGVSRALLAQLSRHRHISLSVRSQRYCKEEDFGYCEPFAVMMKPELREKYEVAMEAESRFYGEFLAEGLKPEDARMVLPNACVTELYLTANARALIEMSRLRMCRRAQEEIRKMFIAMRDEVAKESRMVADMMVPKCQQYKYKFCTEKDGCGMAPSLHEVFREDDRK